MPYRKINGVIGDGLVITFVNITVSKKLELEMELHAANAHLKRLVQRGEESA